MHKTEFVQENEKNKILWDFEIQTDHFIPTKRPNLVITNKKTENLPSNGFCRPGKPQSENQRERKLREKLGPCQKKKIKKNNNIAV